VNILIFTLLVAVSSLAAGFLGALTGLGGGVVLVPLLVLVFQVDLSYAIGASLVSVIATSSGAASAYVREGYTNTRIGMFLELATTTGAISGAFLAAYVGGSAISVIFGIVLLVSVYFSGKPHSDTPSGLPPDRIATWLRMNGSYPTAGGLKHYNIRRVPLGFALMYLAGVLSGLLGIGSGALKVLAMDQAMRVPFKVSTTTSNFMIGVTAAASAGVYLSRGYIDPGLTMPVMLGVLIGSLLGAFLLPKLKTRVLRLIFAVVLVVMAVWMIAKGLFLIDLLVHFLKGA
jgi:uncharacterized membrane protein YfcA